MTISGRILRAVKRAPATAPELGAMLWPKMSLYDSRRKASSHLCNLRTRGKLVVIGKVARDGYKDGVKSSRVMANLYTARKYSL